VNLLAMMNVSTAGSTYDTTIKIVSVLAAISYAELAVNTFSTTY
jgi:hypothetical protein